MKVRNIEVGKRIGESPHFRVYLGGTDEGQSVILKVAKSFEDGEILAREAGKFNVLDAFGEELVKLEHELNRESACHNWLFAKILASFTEPTQGDRRINVFAMPGVELDKLVPLVKLCREVEIDVRTSVWMMGRFLKFYTLFELLAVECNEQSAKYPIFSPDDYFIGPERHRLIYYNFKGELEDAIANDFVKMIAKFMLGWIVVADDVWEQEYFELLQDFAEKGRSSFNEAHGEFYALVKRCWGIKYHPFTYRERGVETWNVIEEY